jgi:predicted MPP superfamily phosphohydrolase
LKKSIHRSLGKVLNRLDGKGTHRQNGLSRVEITRLELALPRLGPSFDGYRIVQFSDLHMGTWLNRSRLASVIEMVNQEEPDLVAITGDFVTSDPDRYMEDLVEPLSGLQTRDGAVAVLGNHDHWTDPRAIRQALRRSEITDLSNEVCTLQRGEEFLHIAGVDDFLEDLDRLDLVLGKLPGSGPAILLAHEPDYADESAASGRFGLQISGHTHGGQIVLPLIGPPVLPPRGRKYPAGFYLVKGMKLYTNRGIGTTAIELRLNCPPEITVLTLRADR